MNVDGNKALDMMAHEVGQLVKQNVLLRLQVADLEPKTGVGTGENEPVSGQDQSTTEG